MVRNRSRKPGWRHSQGFDSFALRHGFEAHGREPAVNRSSPDTGGSIPSGPTEGDPGVDWAPVASGMAPRCGVRLVRLPPSTLLQSTVSTDCPLVFARNRSAGVPAPADRPRYHPDVDQRLLRSGMMVRARPLGWDGDPRSDVVSYAALPSAVSVEGPLAIVDGVTDLRRYSVNGIAVDPATIDVVTV